MNVDKGFIHPEVLKEVKAEFNRLHAKHPDLDGTELWAMSRDYVWTVALADTALFRVEMLI